MKTYKTGKQRLTDFISREQIYALKVQKAHQMSAEWMK